jgi:serine protease Do
MNGEPVKNSRDLRLRVAETPPGTEVRLKIIRDGKTQEIAVKLGELPEKAQAASAEGGENETLSGVRVEALTPQIARQLRLNPATQGVVVDDVAEASAAADAGLQRGDVIEEVDRKPVTSAAAFERAAREAGQNPVLLLINRQGNTSFVLVQPQ